jgi:outer membrane protein OmpA-like peptidoglycan-associated protein
MSSIRRLTMFDRRRPALLILLLFTALGSPRLVADVAGSSDYASFQRFPGATIVDYRQQTSAVYNLALGRMQRAAGTVAASRAERFQGHLRRITYEIPDGFPAAEVFAFYREQLLNQGQQALYTCQGRGCGSSNFWANDVFENRILYGPETNQYYLASTYQGVSDESEVAGYAALYVVTRGNRRMYAHLDFLELPAPLAAEQLAGLDTTPQALEQRLARERAVVITGLSFNDNDELDNADGINLIVDVLRRNALMEVYVVGHLQDSGSLTQLQTRSERRALAVIDRVVAAGIDADRMQAHGLGPLAPVCRPGPCGQRIELVLALDQ